MVSDYFHLVFPTFHHITRAVLDLRTFYHR